jgi:hypothetical protein
MTKVFTDSNALDILCNLVDKSINISQYGERKCERYKQIAYRFKQYIQDPSEYNKSCLLEVCGDYNTIDDNLNPISFRMSLPIALDDWYKVNKILEKV